MSTQSKFVVRPLPADLAQRVRSRRDSSVEVRTDASPHQCRVCLRLTKPFEPYLLFSHVPFENETAYSERGPVFIHARECSPYAENERLPPEFPRDIVLRAYDAQGAISDARWSDDGSDLEEQLSALFRNEATAFVHARNRTYGCFMYRVERTAPGEGGA